MNISSCSEGVDLILKSIFRNLKKGYYIDIRCNQPIDESNTYIFYKLGWKGLAIDGNAKFKKKWISHSEVHPIIRTQFRY